MTKRECFDVGVRLIGVWQIAVALDEFVTFANVVLNLYTPAATTAGGFLRHALGHLLVGIYLLFFSGGLTNAVFGPVAERGVDEV